MNILWQSSWLRCLHIHPDPLAMVSELRCIHALNACDPIAEIPDLAGEQVVFKYVSAAGQPRKEEVRTGIFRALIIAQAALPFVLADHIGGLDRKSVV